MTGPEAIIEHLADCTDADRGVPVMAAGNPYRDPAARIELGQRALEALMTRQDWQEIIARWVAMELGPWIDDAPAVNRAAALAGIRGAL